MEKETWVKCQKCGTVLNTNTNYSYVECACGAIAVDGGKEYCRIIGEKENWKFVEV